MIKPSIQDLIKLAKQQDVSEAKTSHLAEVERFILALDIKDGKFKVKNVLLYQAYKKWALKPMSRPSFLTLFSKYIIPGREEHFRYYFLNYRPIELITTVDKMKIKI